jgi:hypothetical protein
MHIQTTTGVGWLYVIRWSIYIHEESKTKQIIISICHKKIMQLDTKNHFGKKKSMCQKNNKSEPKKSIDIDFYLWLNFNTWD